MIGVVAWKQILAEEDPVVRERIRADLLGYYGLNAVLLLKMIDRVRGLIGYALHRTRGSSRVHSARDFSALFMCSQPMPTKHKLL